MAKTKLTGDGDYFSPDGNYKEPKYKFCPVCDGHEPDPDCTICEGTNQVEMTDDEINEEEDFARDREADLNED